MTPLVALRDVDFAYPAPEGRRERRFSLLGLSFTIEAGEIFGIVGPNSAGKTTVLRIISRVLPADRGEVLLDGRPLRRLDPWEIARTIAVVPQEAPRPFPFTVEQLVLMGRYPHAPARFFESAEDLGIASDAMGETGVLDLAALPLESLSGGERQRAMLARALAQRPRLLVLDEPTAHLDLRYQVEAAGLIRRANRERGITILLVSHDLGLAAELCDRLLLLDGGRIARLGTPEQVLEASVLEAVFRCRVIVEKSPLSGRPLVQVAWPAVEEGR